MVSWTLFDVTLDVSCIKLNTFHSMYNFISGYGPDSFAAATSSESINDPRYHSTPMKSGARSLNSSMSSDVWYFFTLYECMLAYMWVSVCVSVCVCLYHVPSEHAFNAFVLFQSADVLKKPPAVTTVQQRARIKELEYDVSPSLYIRCLQTFFKCAFFSANRMQSNWVYKMMWYTVILYNGVRLGRVSRDQSNLFVLSNTRFKNLKQRNPKTNNWNNNTQQQRLAHWCTHPREVSLL
jgi:hypothetical protein